MIMPMVVGWQIGPIKIVLYALLGNMRGWALRSLNWVNEKLCLGGREGVEKQAGKFDKLISLQEVVRLRRWALNSSTWLTRLFEFN